jgi:hypothetical protein
MARMWHTLLCVVLLGHSEGPVIVEAIEIGGVQRYRYPSKAPSGALA